MTTAVITGAARGIGRAIAERLAADGFRLVLVDVSPSLAETVADLEKAGAHATPVTVDLTAEDGPGTVSEAAGDDVTLVVNNAGITRDARLINMSHDDFTSVLDVNLGAAYRLSRQLGERMTEGAIVNLASRAYLGNFGQFNYSMSKGGIVGMTRALALSYAPRIRVNAIAPGLIGTEMAMGIPEDIRNKMVDQIPLGRMGRPEEVADLVSFLASDRSSYVTGQVLVIGGGRSLT